MACKYLQILAAAEVASLQPSDWRVKSSSTGIIDTLQAGS
jgi:hypothetical protein